MTYTKFRSKIFNQLKAFLQIVPTRSGNDTFFLVQSEFFLGKTIKVACFFRKPLTADFVLDYLLGRMLMAAADKYDMDVSYSDICDDFRYSVDDSVLEDFPFVSFQLSEKEYEL